MTKDYYFILEIKHPSNEYEIKQAYRKLALKYHPDKNYGNKIFEEKFREINEAYNILVDPDKKRYYDSKYKEHINSRNQSSEKTNTSENNSSRKTETSYQKNNTENVSSSIFEIILNKSNRKYFLASIIIILAFIIYHFNDISGYYAKKEFEEQKKYLIQSASVTKEYEEKSLSSLGLQKLLLQTKWRDSIMYYKFEVANYSKFDSLYIGDKSYPKNFTNLLEEKDYFQKNAEKVKHFTINMLDDEGFKKYSFEIPRGEMTREINSFGYVEKLLINSSVNVNPEVYKEFKNWECTITN